MERKKQQFLSEENYQRTKKKISGIAIFILLIGLLLGGGLIGFGVYKSIDKSNSGAQRVEEIEIKIKDCKEELALVNNQLDEEFLENGFSTEYGRLSDRSEDLEGDIRDLENEKWEVSSNSSSKMGTFGLYAGGGMIIFLSLAIFGFITFYANSRGIVAYSMQSTMPIVQEGMEKVAPSMGKVAEEMARGIKRGLDDDDNN